MELEFVFSKAWSKLVKKVFSQRDQKPQVLSARFLGIFLKLIKNSLIRYSFRYFGSPGLIFEEIFFY